MLQKLNLIIKYAIIVFLITLAILSYTYKFGNCDKCSFEINDTKINSKEFMEIYQPICLKAPDRYLNTSFNIKP